MVDSNETRIRVGNVIKNARLKKELTQRQLGELLGKSNNTITNWEKGENSPDVDMIELLCLILDIPVSEMFPSRKDELDIGLLTDDETKLILNWRKLSKEDQIKIVGMIELKLNDIPN